MFKRTIKFSSSSSFFLFGPRGTGKTTLLRSHFSKKKAVFIDLLDPFEEEIFVRNPSELENRMAALPDHIEWVVLDEIQKVPKLLDLVHKLIETTSLKFVLTGSSARKLKRGASNLLAGRAFMYHLHPLTHQELGKAFNLSETLQWGSLPKIFQFDTSEDKAQYLRAYALTYLKEEIVAEQIVRKLDPFRQFLEVAAQSNGKIINFSKIAADISVDTKTVQSYFTILEDTLIGIILPAYHKSIRKRQRANPKFYFFDTGVKRALDRTLNLELQEGTYAFGNAFEHFLIIEMIRLSRYENNDWSFFYLRTKDDAEIDLIIERPGMPVALIEIKSTTYITKRDVSNFRRFIKDFPSAEAFCISRDLHEKKIDGVWCLPWEKALVKVGLV